MNTKFNSVWIKTVEGKIGGQSSELVCHSKVSERL